MDVYCIEHKTLHLKSGIRRIQYCDTAWPVLIADGTNLSVGSRMFSARKNIYGVVNRGK